MKERGEGGIEQRGPATRQLDVGAGSRFGTASSGSGATVLKSPTTPPGRLDGAFAAYGSAGGIKT